MRKFKVGDIVRVTHNSGPLLKGSEYVIQQVDWDICNLDDGQFGWWMHEQYLELATAREPVELPTTCCGKELSLCSEEGLHGECLECGNIYLKDGDVLKNETELTSEPQSEQPRTRRVGVPPLVYEPMSFSEIIERVQPTAYWR